jgi:hypothetical protein
MTTAVWIALLVIAIALVLILYWRGEVMAPRVAFSILPPYDIPEVIVVGGVLVENRGRSSAFNVQITVQYDPTEASKIAHMKVLGDEGYVLRSGGETFSHAVVRLREMKPGQKLVIYVSGPLAVTPQVTVTSA